MSKSQKLEVCNEGISNRISLGEDAALGDHRVGLRHMLILRPIFQGGHAAG